MSALPSGLSSNLGSNTMTIMPYRQGREGWGEKRQPQRSQNKEFERWKLRQVWICTRMLPTLCDLIEFLLAISLAPVPLLGALHHDFISASQHCYEVETTAPSQRGKG